MEQEIKSPLMKEADAFIKESDKYCDLKGRVRGMKNGIEVWAQAFIKDAMGRNLPAESIEFIQMNLADLQMVLGRNEGFAIPFPPAGWCPQCKKPAIGDDVYRKVEESICCRECGNVIQTTKLD